MLGLAGFRVIQASEVAGELELVIESEPAPAGCPLCGVLAVGHGRLEVRHRDVPLGGRPTVLVWRKRRWRCPEPICPVRTWVESSPLLPSRRVLTDRAAAEVAASIAAVGGVVERTAARFGIAWATAWNCFTARAAPAVAQALGELASPRAVGVDETSFLRPGRRRFGDRWCTSIVDLAAGRLLDVVPGRSSEAITHWVSARGAGWAAGVEVTVCDPFRAYARGLRRAVPGAELVADHYHVVKLGLDALEAVRANMTRETLGRRGRTGDHLFDLRRRLLTAPDRLTDANYVRLQARLGHGDPHGQVRQAWRLAHQLRHLGDAGSARGARRRLDAIIAEAAASPRPELRRLARTLTEWRAPICARYDNDRITNAAVEAINTLIKRVKRSGHGYRNFGNYRLRLLTACGKIQITEARTTTRLRTRQPQLAA
jgi:transposase